MALFLTLQNGYAILQISLIYLSKRICYTPAVNQAAKPYGGSCYEKNFALIGFAQQRDKLVFVEMPL